MSIAHQEHVMGQYHMNSSNSKHLHGIDQLQQAQAQQQQDEDNTNNTIGTGRKHGFCRIFSFVCNRMRKSSSPIEDENHDPNNNNYMSQTNATFTTIAPGGVVIQPTDDNIHTNKMMEDAMVELTEAKQERTVAMELLNNSSYHTNMSIQILQEAQIFQQEAEYDANQSIIYRNEAQQERTEGLESTTTHIN